MKYATCHPDRKHKAKGLCRRCHDKIKVLKARFGLSMGEYTALLSLQDGVCAICLRPEPVEGKRLAVDHDHVTKVNRGLLCSNCNMGLGQFGDNIDLLKRAALYLERFKK
jgi:Autographiviridae endonuclease VII